MKTFLVIAAIAAAAPAVAGEPLEIATDILTERPVAQADGTTRPVLVRPARVGPGDRVVLMVHFRNAGTAPLAGVTIADTVPRGLTYRGPRAGSPPPEVSVSGNAYAPLERLRVAVPGGGSRPARADEVTGVRWRLAGPLAAGGQGQFAFEAAIN